MVKEGTTNDISVRKWDNVDIKVSVEEKDWLQRSYIGRVHDMSNIGEIRESFILNGLEFIHIRYLGDNAMLLTPEGEDSVGKVVKENHEWLSTMFESITAWSNHTSIGNKRIWVRCRGYSDFLMGMGVFRKGDWIDREINKDR